MMARYIDHVLKKASNIFWNNLLCLNALSGFPVPSLFLKFYLLGRRTRGKEK